MSMKKIPPNIYIYINSFKLGFENVFLSFSHSPAEGAECHPEKPQPPTYLSIGLCEVRETLPFTLPCR